MAHKDNRTRITVELTREDAQRLLKAAQEGNLVDLGVLSITGDALMDSEPIFLDHDHGSAQGVVYYDPLPVHNWLDGINADHQAHQLVNTLTPPFAILNTMSVQEAHRGQGYGTTLLDEFLIQCADANVFLVADTVEENAFSLSDWYERNGFVVVGQAGANPIMIFYRE